VISEEFLRLVRCPISRTALTAADEHLIARLNEAVAAGRIANRIGEVLSRPLDGGLVNQDRSWLFPVYNDIPTLMADAAIALDQLDS
jgi:uncharacterized protein YbaR (Trm112 family)